jgi:serine/threonine protein phosphatase PrpC
VGYLLFCKVWLLLIGIYEKSRTGYIPIGPETGYKAKQNQDAYMTIKGFADVPGQWFIGVFDGHGFNGQKVSKFIKKRLPRNIKALMQNTKRSFMSKVGKRKVNDLRIISSINKRRTSVPDNVENEIIPESNIFDLMNNSQKNKIIENSFLQTQLDLKKQRFDNEYSGTTAVSVVISPIGIVTWANIGDSRAVLISECGGKWKVSDLSNDHKPELPEEIARIDKYGGRVEAYKDENGDDFGPKRVWLKHENLPGLAMSRSFGDLCACRAGVIQDPEIIEHKLSKDDRAIVLASDGVWEFLSSEDVMNILIPYIKEKQEVAGKNLFIF